MADQRLGEGVVEDDLVPVEEHRVCGTLPDGSNLDLAACVVADVRDGRICALREYMDTAAAAGLVAALS